MRGQIRLYHQEHFDASCLAITGTYADCPNVLLHAPAVIDVPDLLRSIMMIAECEVTPIPEHFKASYVRRGARGKKRQFVKRLDAGPEWVEASMRPGLNDNEAAMLEGAVGMGVGNGEMPLSYYDDDL